MNPLPESSYPLYLDSRNRLWEDRDGPLLLTPDADEYPGWVTMQAIEHAYGPLRRVNGPAPGEYSSPAQALVEGT